MDAFPEAASCNKLANVGLERAAAFTWLISVGGILGVFVDDERRGVDDPCGAETAPGCCTKVGPGAVCTRMG